MPNLSTRKPTDRFHGLVYGDSGSGKTHLLGTFPDLYIMDTDFGLEPLVGKDVEFDEFYVRAGENNAREIWPEVLAKVDEFVDNPPHDTLAIDSLTTMCDVVVAYVLGRANRATLQLQDYQTVYNELTKLIVRLRRVPCNAILTAHEETTRDETTGKLLIRPLVIGRALSPMIPIFFTNIYNAVVRVPKGNRQTERYLLVSSDGTRIAKTQVETDVLQIPKSYDSIMEHISGGRDVEAAA